MLRLQSWDLDRIARGLVLLAALFIFRNFSPAEENSLSPEGFADRWVEATRTFDGDPLSALLREDAKIHFESEGHDRFVTLKEYGELLEGLRGFFKAYDRRRGPVDVIPVEGTKGSLLSFKVQEHIETQEGFVVENEATEEFEFGPGGIRRAAGYHSTTRFCETLKKPEEWMRYGGPIGLNGFLINAHFNSSPKWMTLWVIGGIACLAIFLKVIISLGFHKR